MATIKSYTNLQQSKKLATILHLESADMNYWCGTQIRIGGHRTMDKDLDVPAWSLSALLSVLPDYTLSTNTDGTVFVICESEKPMISDAYDNPVDACYWMILKLHELNLL